MTSTGTIHDLTTERVPVAELHTYHRNPRQGRPEVIAQSLRVNGQYRPLVVNRGTHTARQAEVLAGNHTLMAARDLGWSQVAVCWVDVDDDQAARIVAADNRTSDLGGYDDRLLAELLGDLPDLDGTGYDPGDLDDLMAGLEEATDDDDALGGNQRKTAGINERKETYDTGQGQRVIVLGYGSARYVWVVEALTELLGKYGVDTNADALVAVLEEATGTTAPADDTPDVEEAE